MSDTDDTPQVERFPYLVTRSFWLKGVLIEAPDAVMMAEDEAKYLSHVLERLTLGVMPAQAPVEQGQTASAAEATAATSASNAHTDTVVATHGDAD